MKDVLIYVSVYKTEKEFIKQWGKNCIGVAMHKKTTDDKKNHIYLYKNATQKKTLKHETMHILISEFNLMQKIPQDELKKMSRIRNKAFNKLKFKTKTPNKNEEFLTMLYEFNKKDYIKNNFPKTFLLTEQMKKKYKVIIKQRTRNTF